MRMIELVTHDSSISHSYPEHVMNHVFPIISNPLFLQASIRSRGGVRSVSLDLHVERGAPNRCRSWPTALHLGYLGAPAHHFPLGDAPWCTPNFAIFLCKRAARDATFSNVLMSFLWTLNSEIAHINPYQSIMSVFAWFCLAQACLKQRPVPAIGRLQSFQKTHHVSLRYSGGRCNGYVRPHRHEAKLFWKGQGLCGSGYIRSLQVQLPPTLWNQNTFGC